MPFCARHHVAIAPGRILIEDPFDPARPMLLVDAIRACSHAPSTRRLLMPTKPLSGADRARGLRARALQRGQCNASMYVEHSVSWDR